MSNNSSPASPTSPHSPSALARSPSSRHHRSVLLVSNFKSDRDSTKEEIISTEKRYLEALEILHNVYFVPLLKKKLLVSNDITDLMSVLSIITNFNTMLLKNLESSSNTDNMGEKFLIVIPFLKTYTDYFNNYEKVSNLIRDAKRTDKKFAEWLSRTERQCKLENKLDLKSYLIQPVQRIPRYNLLLKELLKVTDSSHNDYQNIKKALDGTVFIADFLNKKMKEIKSDQMKDKLLATLQFETESERDELLKPHKRYFHEGQLEVIESSNRTITPYDINDTYHYVLMSDVILVCEKVQEEGEAGSRQSMGGTIVEVKRVIHQIPLVGDVPWVKIFSWQPLAIQLNCSEGSVLFKCKTREEVSEWVSQVNALGLYLDETGTAKRARCRYQPQTLLRDAAVLVQSLYRGKVARTK